MVFCFTSFILEIRAALVASCFFPMPSIVVHNFIMTCISSACPPVPPEGKLGTTLRVEDGSLVSPRTTDGTPEGLERSVGAVHNFIMTCKSLACPTAPSEGKLGTTLRVEDGRLVSPGATAGPQKAYKKSVGVPGNEE